MHNPAPVPENNTQKLLWDFDIQTDHLILARRPDLIIINKKKKRICKIVDIAVPADHKIKLKECEKKNKYMDLARGLKKTIEREGDNYTSCDWCFWYSNSRIWRNGYRRRKWTRRHEFKSWTRLIAFHMALIPLRKVWIQLFSLQLWVNSRTDLVLQPWRGN